MTQKLYSAKATVIAKANSKERAIMKIFKRKMLVDEVTEVKEDKLQHIKDGEYRQKLRESITRDLKTIESRN